jgi:hypothetical protein
VLACSAAIVGCHAAIVAGSKVATGVLYVLREAYIVLLVEQVWSFVNSTLSTGECRKLNGPLCGVASLGAIGGGLLVRNLAVTVGSANLLVFAALASIPVGFLAALAFHLGGEPLPAPDEAGGRRGHLGAGVLLANSTLRRLAALIALTQIVSTVLDLYLSRMLETTVTGIDLRTQWFGGFYAQLNLGSAVFQFVVTPLLLRFVPLVLVHAAIPLAHLTLCVIAIRAHPSLSAAAAALMVFKVLDYSVFRGAKELLYIPLSFDARYRAKQLIDAFGYRFAKGGASVILAIAGRFVTIPAAALPSTAVAALLGWLPLAALVALSASAARSRRAETGSGAK